MRGFDYDQPGPQRMIGSMMQLIKKENRREHRGSTIAALSDDSTLPYLCRNPAIEPARGALLCAMAEIIPAEPGPGNAG